MAPTLEEIDDDDIDDLDFNIEDHDPYGALTVPKVSEPPLFPPLPSVSSTSSQPRTSQHQPSRNDTLYGTNAPGMSDDTKFLTPEDLEGYKHNILIYPCYFDKNRSHKQGRRVNLNRAVENPLAKTVHDAMVFIGIPCVLDAMKSHPQDWSNPGRVRLMVTAEEMKDELKINNERHLLRLISDFLLKRPTTINTPKQFIPSPEFRDIELKSAPIPRGFVMNSIIPLHSPAIFGAPMTQSIYDDKDVAPNEMSKRKQKGKGEGKKVKYVRG